MIIEDDHIIAEDLRDRLIKMNYNVTAVVDSGELAFKEARDNRLDIVLTDIMLYNSREGIDIAKKLRSYFNLPVIYMTAFIDDQVIEKGIKSGPYGYLIKPFDDNELKYVIEMGLYKFNMDKKLEESEEKFRDLVEKAGIAILIDDRSGRFLYYNRMFYEIFGYSSGEIKKQTIRTLVHPDDVNRVFKIHTSRLQGKRVPSRYEFKGIRKDGTAIYLEVDAIAVKENHAITGTRSYIWDITDRKNAEQELENYSEKLEDMVDRRTLDLMRINRKLQKEIEDRKQAEEALRQSQDKYRDLVENLNEVIYALDIEGRITYISPTLQTFYGFSPEDVLGHHFKKFLNKEEYSRIKENFYKVLQGESTSNEYRIKTKSGEPRWTCTSSRPIVSDNQVIGVQGVLSDITERRRVEDALKESEKLAAQGRMAAGIAHEINNPLGSIKNSIVLLKDAVPKNHPYFQLISRTEDEIKRISNIVHQMYDLYHPEKEAATEFNLWEVINEVCSLLEAYARGNRISIIKSIPSKVILLSLPRGRIIQVLYNILKNGIDACADGGHVKIKVTEEIRKINISIEDNGTGIPQKDYERIFEPFFTTKNNQESKGLGLGLPLSKSIVESLGGTIDFKSRFGKGTVFIIHFPLIK